MAEVATDGLREAIRQLEKADLYSDENIKAMLNAGAEIIMRDVKSAFVQSGHNRPASIAGREKLSATSHAAAP